MPRGCGFCRGRGALLLGAVPWQEQTQPGIGVGLEAWGWARPRGCVPLPGAATVTGVPAPRSPLPRKAPRFLLLTASSSRCPGGVWLTQESCPLLVTALLKPWAVWLLNKRAAVPAVGTGKPQRWLPGTRGSRLVSVTLCPPSPFFFFFYIFLLCPVLCQAAPSLAPSPSSWGFVRPSCALSCALLAAPWLSCATCECLQLATGPGPCFSGTDMGCAPTQDWQNCTPASSPAPFSAQTLPLLQKMPRVPRKGRMLSP